MSRKPGCWKPWCRCWRGGCWKFGSRWPGRVLRYAARQGYITGHVYICLDCGLWHWTKKARRTNIRPPNPAQLRAIERRRGVQQPSTQQRHSMEERQ